MRFEKAENSPLERAGAGGSWDRSVRPQAFVRALLAIAPSERWSCSSIADFDQDVSNERVCLQFPLTVEPLAPKLPAARFADSHYWTSRP
jgi:hypothetical protein